MRLLVVEDEKRLLDILKKRLMKEHYSVDGCANGNEAWEYIQMTEYDGIILDIMLPGIDGITLLKKVRATGKKTPVLLLTARDSIEDRVNGLDAGADDYLVKPFAFEELLARIRVMLRRTSNLHAEEEKCYVCNHMKINYDRYIATFFVLYKKGEPEFMKLVKEGKGLCIHHLADILDAAPMYLNDKQQAELRNILFPQMDENIKRVLEELDWFQKKFDYRYENEPWYNSKDAIERAVVFLRSDLHRSQKDKTRNMGGLS